ncbi:MAG: hypothetical protein SOW25_02915, partial [Helicobacter sp.]|nr:hypothetical protein [Helicobacter sp.]
MRFCFFSFIFTILIFCGCSSTAFNTNSTINNTLTPPTNIRVISDVNTIAFEWNLTKDSNAVGYHIYRKKA